MDNRRLKEGTLQCYLRSCLILKKWKEAWVELHDDSRLVVREEKGEKPKFSVLLKDVIPYMAVGLVCDRMPVRRPNLPEGFSVHHLLGISLDPHADTVHWILFSSDQDMESWFGEIMKTLQKPPAPTGNEPPPQYDEKAPGGPMGGPGGPPGQPGQPGNTVVVVQGQQGSGMDGMMTGMLLGTLAGYGMGSFFGGIGGFGMGGFGMGGAFTETNITNNYYGDQSGGGDQPNDDGGYDGGDYGGGDFAGDFGGGDFGGGDFGF